MALGDSGHDFLVEERLVDGCGVRPPKRRFPSNAAYVERCPRIYTANGTQWFRLSIKRMNPFPSNAQLPKRLKRIHPSRTITAGRCLPSTAADPNYSGARPPDVNASRPYSSVCVAATRMPGFELAEDIRGRTRLIVSSRACFWPGRAGHGSV